MKRFLPELVTTAFLTLALITPSFAQNQGGQGNPPQGQKMGQQGQRMNQQGPQTIKQRFMKKFGITEEQATKIETMKNTKQKVQRETNARQKIIRAEAEYLWMADKIDKKAIMAKYTEVEQMRRKAFIADADFKYALAEALTPQQRSELMDMMKNKRGQRGQRGQRGTQGQRSRGRGNTRGGGGNTSYGQGNDIGSGNQNHYRQQQGGGYDDGGYDFDNVTDGDNM